MNRNLLKTCCLFLSITLFVTSLFLPAAVIPEIERGLYQINYGYEIFCFGWLGLISWQPAWLANPFYVMALLTYGSKKSYVFASLSFFLALFSPFILVVKLLIGFYIWLGSIVILLYGVNLHERRL
ncbi:MULTISPECIES: hypothetical protein [Legionella]|uniref:Transmembrane protein n=1 Tax=Legionella resiliens TaxID=2905958 RepID=A0ABS8X0Y6_9GAMM|nr:MULTISPECIES: hypothetical protein [unclassified Legionella]MCE0721806.1 hypothetical protein [Legionella sp. 9fVS26]MCE3530960.1 hypothetical protein [Legionella sp. 8cVS16]QLZ70521.1 hypothetical protein FOLKNPGA_03335 [Legionella sp. PC1000]